MHKSKIDWTEMVWNPVVGCEGPDGAPCPYCYAHRMARRRLGEYGRQPVGAEFHPRFLPERLTEPLKARQPARIFVGSMTDLFGEAIQTEWLDAILEVVATCRQHTFIALSKRPDRFAEMLYGCSTYRRAGVLPNLWLGVSVTNEDDINRRVPPLLSISVAKRIVSYEPMLGPAYSLGRGFLWPDDISWPRVDWLIMGAESGNRAEKGEPQKWWIEAVVSLCRKSGIPLYEKRSLTNIVDRPLIQEYPIGERI